MPVDVDPGNPRHWGASPDEPGTVVQWISVERLAEAEEALHRVGQNFARFRESLAAAAPAVQRWAESVSAVQRSMVQERRTQRQLIDRIIREAGLTARWEALSEPLRDEVAGARPRHAPYDSHGYGHPFEDSMRWMPPADGEEEVPSWLA